MSASIISIAIGKYCFVNLNKREKPPMRFMIIVKATKDSESGLMPSAELLKDMANSIKT